MTAVYAHPRTGLITTPFALILAWPLLGERPALQVVLGVLLAFSGVAVSVVHPGGVTKLVPTLFMVGSGFALAMGTVLTKRYGPFRPLKLLAWMSAFTVLQVLLASALFEQGQIASLYNANHLAWMAFAYTVFFGAITGYCLWFWLIANCSMARIAPFALLQTVFAVIAGVAFLHEPLTVTLVTGAVVCVVGVGLTQAGSFDWGFRPIVRFWK